MPPTRWIIPVILSIIGALLAAGRERTSIVVSPVQEVALGEKARAEFFDSHPLSTDGNLAIRIDEIGRTVARVSDRPQLLYRFVVVQGEELQAYSFPGGTIVLTEGLARLFDTDDEFAFALAHEIAHIALRHHVFTFRLRHAASSEAPPERVMMATIKGRLDSDQEMEADRYGALYAVRAGYRFNSAWETLERMSEESRYALGDAAHPEYSRRVIALQEFRRELDLSLRAFEEGTAALRAGRCDDAISSLSYFVAEFPNSASGRVNLGSAYLAKVRETAGTPMGLAEVLPILPEPGVVIRGFYDRLDLEDARDHFRKAIAAEPEDVAALAGLALVEMRLGELQRARRHMDEALRVAPDDPDLLLCSGNVYYLGGQYRDAVSHYVAALSIRPEWPPAWKNLALTYESLERTAEALSLWRGLVGDEQYGAEARQRVRDLSGGRD